MPLTREPIPRDTLRTEPRCRICRDEALRHEVDRMLDWRGVPVKGASGRMRHVTYTDALRALEPLNDGRDERDRITYDSLWVHAKRHYDIDGVMAYWSTHLMPEFRKNLRAALT